MIGGLRQNVENLVRELRESGAKTEVVRKVKREISEIERSRPVSSDSASHSSIENLHPGLLVKIRGTETIGEIVEVIDAKKVSLTTAGKRVIVAIENLEITREKPLVLFKQNVFIDFSDVKNEIDLRGRYGDESIEQLDKFIDKAMLLRLQRVRIIHGKGTGELRKRVSEYLSKNKNVGSFQLGEWNEGGGGVTIAILNV